MKKEKFISRDMLLRDESRPFYPSIPHDAEPIALVYPNAYNIGMSSLGFLSIYKSLEEIEFRPERFFLDVTNKTNLPVSIESGVPLSRFKKIAFHFSYELDYINSISMLRNSGIEISRKLRKTQGGPILIAGGIAPTANPLPLSNFMDLIFIGETDDIDTLLPLHEPDVAHHITKENLNGWFITEEFEKNQTDYEVHHRYSNDWRIYESYSPIITPKTVFKNMNLIEITRGCPIRCKFCLSGCIHGKKVRERYFEKVIESATRCADITKKVGLIGAIPSLHSKITEILSALLGKGFSYSLSAVSVNSISDEILELLSKGGMKTLTLGVETFDESLQKRVGKPIPYDKLINRIRSAIEIGFNEIKLYMMLGLPETSDNEESLLIESIINLRHEIKILKPSTGFSISLNPFIPKVATIYEKEKFMGDREFRKKISAIRKALSPQGVRITSESHKGANLQNIFSRGDDRVSEIIIGELKGENTRKIMRAISNDDEDTYLLESLEKINKIIIR